MKIRSEYIWLTQIPSVTLYCIGYPFSIIEIGAMQEVGVVKDCWIETKYDVKLDLLTVAKFRLFCKILKNLDCFHK